ncbi:MAG: SusD/RagB family nutrient-binding outer membrane lipoprotein [Sphingobacteriaceae bacterium]|nr:MAG: SusD/RagB family nutrient-binding outer membrane lipoprotein [Sphingobacteriaceae bacterium]
MKKLFSILFVAMLLLSTLISGCKKSFEDLTQNTNVPNSVPASLLFNGILNSMVEYPDNSKEIYDQYYIYNYDYYGNNRYDFGSGDNYYATLKNVLAMEAQATKSGSAAVNPYSAIGKFFRAYFFSKMSMEEGDIPMTQALQGATNLTPVYDTQKAVMIQSLAWLESANTDFTTLITAGGNTLTGDIYFNGDLTKWQKVVNTFRIRLLLQLSKKTADIDVVSQFANVVNNPTKYPIMQSADDNLQFIFVAPSNYYPQTPDNFGQSGSRQNSSATYISLLTQNKDPRVFVTAEPARDLVDNQKQSATAFTSFIGADPGLDLGTMYNNAGLQKYSFLNRKRYYSTYTAEPSIQVGYPELMFNIAEGINRGWASGNAESYYIKGIQSSFQFYGIPTGTGTFIAYFYRPGSTSVASLANYDTYSINVDWIGFYAQPNVKYTADAAGLTKILQQKYLALFRHSGLESYFTYRRTGVPNFTTGPGTGNGGRIASRFQYPASERVSNTDNYNKALASQYGGNDDINGVMYILK